ncbi:MAG: manganese catalase family protein [Oscillospiraceae bacterium]|nr:manganese catalase family protein [Oscillospiraceae bacterium]
MQFSVHHTISKAVSGFIYITQKLNLNRQRCKLVTNAGTEELAHVEIISAILYQLTKGLSIDEIKANGFDTYFVDHTMGIYPAGASGVPFTAAYFQSKGDVVTDLTEDMAAEQKARATYENILRLADDADVRDPIRFLREREIVHFQRFGEALRITQDNLNSKNFYACNPAFDKNCGRRR